MGLSKEVIKIEKGKDDITFKSAQAAADYLGLSKSCVCRRCKTEKEHKGIVLKYSGNINRDYSNCEKLKVKCPYCDKRFISFNGLSKHVIRDKIHGDISKEKLLTDYKYNGIRPLCKCGCGGLTNIGYNGGTHFNEYIKGHGSRVHNNWGHNSDAIKHSTETRRNQFINNEREIWNKGKTWDETYDTPTQNRLRKTLKSTERSKKIRQSLKGKPFTKEHILHIREACNKKEYREFFSDLMRQKLSNNKFNLSSDEENKFINECIKPLNIDYITQFYVKDIHQYCDIFIPSKKTIIEFNGTYWHGDPRKYADDELNEFQKKRRKKDVIKKKWADDNDYKLITVWEIDYKNNTNSIKENLKNILNN